MKKRVWIAIILILLSIVSFFIFDQLRDNFEQVSFNRWVSLSGYMIIVYTVFAVFLPDKLQSIKLIPSLIIVGFYILFIIDFQTDPELSTPFGVAAINYTAGLSILVMSLSDLLKKNFQGFKIFVALMMLALNLYGVFTTFSYLAENTTSSIQEKISTVIMTLLVFQLPFIIFFLETFYNKVTIKGRVEVKQAEDIPYNRYRPNDTPIQMTDTPSETKTLAQLQREKNALKGITNLYEAGLLTDEEFERKKKRILSGK